jgi:hypothetical protein
MGFLNILNVKFKIFIMLIIVILFIYCQYIKKIHGYMYIFLIRSNEMFTLPYLHRLTYGSKFYIFFS